MITGKTKTIEILGVQLLGNKHQGLGYVLHKPKDKPIVAQAFSTIKKVTKVDKCKVSIPTAPKVTTSR